MKDNKFKVIGKSNDILTDDIGEGTRIANFCFIGKNVKIGKNVTIGNFCEINAGTTIGDNTLINPYCVFNSNTIIGKNCAFGGSVLTADEKYMTAHTERIKKTPCVIGDNVKIGQHSSLICCKIGDYSTIGACTMVMCDVPAREVWIGSPAKKLRDVNDYEMTL